MLHSRGSGSLWRTYYTAWAADDRCEVSTREAMKLLGFERIRSRDCRRSGRRSKTQTPKYWNRYIKLRCYVLMILPAP